MEDVVDFKLWRELKFLSNIPDTLDNGKRPLVPSD